MRVRRLAFILYVCVLMVWGMYHLVKLELRYGWMRSRDTMRLVGHVNLTFFFFLSAH